MEKLIKKYKLSKRLLKMFIVLFILSVALISLIHIIEFGTNIEKKTRMIIVLTVSSLLLLLPTIGSYLAIFILKNKYYIPYVIYKIYVEKNKKLIERSKKSPMWKKTIDDWNKEISDLYDNDVEKWIEATFS